MEQYHYIFRWYATPVVGQPPVVEVEKHIYAPDLVDAKRQVAEQWPLLSLKSAMVERVKGNGTTEALPA